MGIRNRPKTGGILPVKLNYTMYLLGIEFIYPKNSDPMGSYSNPIQISEFSDLFQRTSLTSLQTLQTKK